MKKVLAVLLISIIVMKAEGQKTLHSDFHPSPGNTGSIPSSYDSLPRIYFGFSTGLNNYSGILGVGTDVRIYKPLFFRAGAGLSTWGYKVTVGIRYELKPGSGWVFGAGYSQCFGLKDFKD